VHGPGGLQLHFSVWQGALHGTGTIRMFFWSDDLTETGLLEWRMPGLIGTEKLRDRQRKLATDAAFRARHRCGLLFPIERHVLDDYVVGEGLHE
jgi:hypothetical protein